MELKTYKSISYVQGNVEVPNGLVDKILDKRLDFFPWAEENNNYDYWTGRMYYNGQIWEIVPETKQILDLAVQALEHHNLDPANYYAKCWVNIWPKDQYINSHGHWGELSGYWVLQDTGTTTLYDVEDETYAIENKTGNFVSISSKVIHRTTTNESDTYRVGLAYTLSTDRQITVEEKFYRREVAHDHSKSHLHTRQFDDQGNLVIRESYVSLKDT